MKKLSDLKIGETGVIHSFENDEIFLKLMEMGCIPGETIRVEQIAPLGDPIFLSVNDTNLAIRKEMASRVFVEIQK